MMNLPVNRSIASESAIVLQMPYLRALANPIDADKTDEKKPKKKILSSDTKPLSNSTISPYFLYRMTVRMKHVGVASINTSVRPNMIS